jgi:maleate cis-trans isomerase
VNTFRAIRLGILYPGHAAEDEYIQFAETVSLPVEIRVVYTEAADSHDIADLLMTGSIERLIKGARELAPWRPDAVMWACTSGSFVFGLAGARRQVEALTSELGVPAGSTSLAFVEALQTLACQYVAILSPYPVAPTEAFVQFLHEAGIAVTSTVCLNSPSGTASSLISIAELERAAEELDCRRAQALLIPDTAIRTLTLIDHFEARFKCKVLTANQVTLWQGLRLAGVTQSDRRLGGLAELGLLANPTNREVANGTIY